MYTFVHEPFDMIGCLIHLKSNVANFSSLQRPKKQREYNTLSIVTDNASPASPNFSTMGNIRRLRDFSSTSNLHNDAGNYSATYSPRDGFANYNREGNFSTSTMNKESNYSTIIRDENSPRTLDRDGNFDSASSQYKLNECRKDMRIRHTGGGGGGGFRASHIQRSEDLDAGQNEALERDVQLLNCCFDDIEKFVSRLQQAAEAFRELEKRKRERSANKKKNKQAGDGMLQMRARPPPAEDFVDIFQKFKFAFNLLSKLKAHIHDPNAPELVHFLFTPLSLIYEASRDPVHNNADLAERALAPLITTTNREI
ncbi:hypothetical protein KUTeg_023306 [Tegillarca granosa]|uniref:EPS8 spectrin-like domain-containing protein n=1 Tax=Tegillarca granosa TaxID=220873 RepID=A0ABQ9E679_TEGGR|nr:hypothetical protein KUTeg_023306 [Tegillarca granosa]